MWSLQALKLGCLLALATLPLLCGLLPALLFRLRGAAANGAWGLLWDEARGVGRRASLSIFLLPDSPQAPHGAGEAS